MSAPLRAPPTQAPTGAKIEGNYNFYPGWNGPMLESDRRAFGAKATSEFPAPRDDEKELTEMLKNMWPFGLPKNQVNTQLQARSDQSQRRLDRAAAERKQPARKAEKQTPVSVLLSPYTPPNTGEFTNTMSSARKLLPLLTRQEQKALSDAKIHPRVPRTFADDDGNLIAIRTPRSGEFFEDLQAAPDAAEAYVNACENALTKFSEMLISEPDAVRDLIQSTAVSTIARKKKSHWGDCGFAVQDWGNQSAWQFFLPTGDGVYRATAMQAVFIPLHALKLYPALLPNQPKQTTYTYYRGPPNDQGEYTYYPLPVTSIRQTTRTTARRAAVQAVDNANAFDRFALSLMVWKLREDGTIDIDWCRQQYNLARSLYRTLHGDTMRLRKVQSDKYATPERLEAAQYEAPIGYWPYEGTIYEDDRSAEESGTLAGPRTARPDMQNWANIWDTLYQNQAYERTPLWMGDAKSTEGVDLPGAATMAQRSIQASQASATAAQEWLQGTGSPAASSTYY